VAAGAGAGAGAGGRTEGGGALEEGVDAEGAGVLLGAAVVAPGALPLTRWIVWSFSRPKRHEER
jgi:hypothetical protein